MRSNAVELKPLPEYVSHRYFRDEETYQKIQRHLVDINDKITDEDIRNIKIVIESKQIEDLSIELEHMITGISPDKD